MKLRIKLKKEDDEYKGTKRIRYDIETLRVNPSALLVRRNEAQINQNANKYGTLAELGEARRPGNITQLKNGILNHGDNLRKNSKEFNEGNPH